MNEFIIRFFLLAQCCLELCYGLYLNNDKEFLMTNEVFDTDDGICKTDDCVQAAEALLANMNMSAEPCEDFFEFACGGWKHKHRVPSTESHWSQFSLVDKKLNSEMRGILESDIEDKEDISAVKSAKKFYKACMDTVQMEDRGVDPLVTLLREFGGWPMTLKEWDEKAFNWQNMLTNHVMFPTPLVALSVHKDSKNSTQRVIYIDQPSLGVMRSMLLDQTTYKDQVGAFKKLIQETAVLVSRSTGQQVQDEIFEKEVEEVLQFETSIAKMSSPNEMRRNSFRIYNPMSLRELQLWTDTSSPNQIQWLELFQNAFKSTGITLDWTERVVVREVDYLFKLAGLLEKTPKRVLANYMNWKLVKRFSSDMNEKMRKLAFSFEKALTGVKQDQPRWKECIQSTSISLPMAVGYSYIKRYFDESAKNVAMEMSERIKAALNEELSSLDWMDPETRKAAQDKVDNMIQLIGYPDWFNNVTRVNNMYNQLVIGKYHFENVVNSRKFRTMENLTKLRKHVNRNEWPIGPAVVNAFNFGQSNAIVFPAGILQPPFFSSGRIEALNYGGIGVVIGHEIIHGFDDDGRQFDKFGNLAQWWSDSTLATYLNKAECFVKQYGSYRLPELDDLLLKEAKVNGVTSQGENIADSGGLHVALRAYRKLIAQQGEESRLPGLDQFTPQQLFYIAFATNWCEVSTRESLLNLVLDDPHSPHRFRVFGSLSNTPDFAQAFNCPKNSAAVCDLW